MLKCTKRSGLLCTFYKDILGYVTASTAEASRHNPVSDSSLQSPRLTFFPLPTLYSFCFLCAIKHIEQQAASWYTTLAAAAWIYRPVWL